MTLQIAPCWLWIILAFFMIQELPAAVSAEQCANQQSSLPFLPGLRSSCQTIYENYPENRDISGYYWVTDYCGMSYSGVSCEDIHDMNPEIRYKPGFYRVKNQWVFCDMTAISNYRSSCAGVGGGWTRIAHFNMTAGDDCPSGWTKDTQSGVNFCRPPGDDPAGYKCYSTHFSASGRSYKKVCGRARGYQKGQVWGFWGSTTTQGNSVEGSYVDGLSITHGNGPRHHIWTYAVGHYDASGASWACPCSPHSATPSPPYIYNNYYCESGARSSPSATTYLFNDTLWDGSGCSNGNTCCSSDHQPWFYRNLGSSTTDNIEARICISYSTYADGAVVVDQLELYIQ